MDRDSIINGSSIDGMSEDWREPSGGDSSPEDGSASFRHITPVCTPLKDTWLGQKQLESMVALQLHLQADPEEAVPSIESKLKANLQSFPFSQCCAYLYANGAGGKLDPSSMVNSYRNTLLSWIGHVTHEGLTAQASLARDAISRFVSKKTPNPVIPGGQTPYGRNEWPPAPQGGSSTHASSPRSQNKSSPRRNEWPPAPQGGSSTHTGSPRAENGSSPGRNGSGSTQHETAPRQNTTSIAQDWVPIGKHGSPPVQRELSRYTSLLKEYCDHHSETQSCDERDISTADHPLHSCRITFRDIVAEGTGRQKRFARHEASFKICQKLGLQLH